MNNLQKLLEIYSVPIELNSETITNSKLKKETKGHSHSFYEISKKAFIFPGEAYQTLAIAFPYKIEKDILKELELPEGTDANGLVGKLLEEKGLLKLDWHSYILGNYAGLFKFETCLQLVRSAEAEILVQARDNSIEKYKRDIFYVKEGDLRRRRREDLI